MIALPGPAVLVPGLLLAGAVAMALGAPGPAHVRLQRLAVRAPTGRAAGLPADGRTAPQAPATGLVAGSVGLVVGSVGLVAGSVGLVVGAVALVVVVLVAGIGPPLLAAVLWVVGRRLVNRRARARDAAQERDRAVEACAALAAELRAGRRPSDALEVAAALARGPCRQALGSAAAAARLGGDVPAALAGPEVRTSTVPGVLRGLAACWRVCATAGSGLAAAVDRLADGLRAGQAQERLVASELAGARASAVLLAVLPVGGVALGAGLGARPLSVLLHTPLGLACLVLGLGLDAVGLWWTGRIVARAAGRTG